MKKNDCNKCGDRMERIDAYSYREQNKVYVRIENTKSMLYACTSADCVACGVVMIVPTYPLPGSEASLEDSNL